MVDSANEVHARWMALNRSPGISLTITSLKQWLIIATAFTSRYFLEVPVVLEKGKVALETLTSPTRGGFKPIHSEDYSYVVVAMFVHRLMALDSWSDPTDENSRFSKVCSRRN